MDHRRRDCDWRIIARFWLTNRIFLISAIAYLLLRFIIRPIHSFDWWTDLLLIPVALPPTLGLYEILGLRRIGQPISFAEVLLHLFIWSSICEGIGPLLYSSSVADVKDVIAYTVGGLGFYSLTKLGSSWSNALSLTRLNGRL